MKKSKLINLVFVSAVLASTIVSCTSKKEQKSNLYVRTDTTGRYSQTRHGGFYHGFYPVGTYNNGTYTRSGFHTSSSHASSSTTHSSISRGGFGHSGGHVGA